MSINLGQLIVWLIIGALAGWLAGILIKGRKGYGLLGNILIGLIGALIGGVLFDLLNISLGLGALTFSLDDLVAAVVGSLILLGVIYFIRNR